MSTTAQAIAGFETLVKKHKIEPKHSCESILAAIEQVRFAKPTAYHQKHIAVFLEERAKVLNLLVNDYIKANISAKYPCIHPDLWQLRRNLQLKFIDNTPIIVKDEIEGIPAEKGRLVITVPLFAWVNFSDKKTVFELYKNELNSSDYKSVKVHITAEMPGMLGSNLRRAYRTALADAYHVVSKLLYEDGVGDALSDDLDSLKTDVIVVWIPTIESLKIKHEVVHPPIKYDPAMIMRVRGQCFLVALWTIDDEVPLEHFIREYTEGSFAKIVKESN